MSKEIYISSTPHETRLAIVEDEALTEIYYERENEYTLAGSIYNGRVTRVLPGMQSSFVDVGLERDAFLYITDFMEETPNPEEFDTAPAGDRGSRAPRVSSGEGSGEAAPRSESGERNDRGERGGRGRRGGRDRNSNNPERQGADAGTQQGEYAAPDQARNEGENASEEAAPREFNEGGEIGEGAPGADGSRRWRGRRGRRRGRGNSGQAGDSAIGQAGDSGNQSDDQGQQGSAPGSSASGSSAAGNDEGPGYSYAPSYSETPAYSGDESSFERKSYVQIDAEAAPVGDVAASGDEQRRGAEGSRGEGQRGRGRRGGRNGRNRDGQRNDSSRGDSQRTDAPRGDSEQGGQRAPRGFEPSRNLYGADSEAGSGTGPIANAYPDEDLAAGAEPIILPGESLSKYRKGGEEKPSAGATIPATTVTLAPPANLYTLAEGWDGGATLPGETISQRNPSSESRSDSRGSRDSRRDGRGERNNRNNSRTDRAETRQESRRDLRNEPVAGNDATISAVESAVVLQQPQEISSPSAESVLLAEVVREFNQHDIAEAHIVESAEVAQTAEAVAPETPALETTEPEAVAAEVAAPVEYEPEDASASYRVDPVPPREFRQSAPVVEEAPVADEPLAAEAPVEEPVVAEAESVSAVEDPIAALPEAEAVPSIEPVAEEPAAEIHDVTSISAAGEMLSAVVETPLVVEAVAEAEESFAPGVGQLEEEILYEDESEPQTIQASAIEEIDDLDDETIDGATELGNMLREMSIDQITHTEPEVEEQDELGEDEDFDEDELDEEEQNEEDEDADQSDESESDEEEDEEAARTGTAADAEFFEKQFGQAEESNRSDEQGVSGEPRRSENRDADRRGGRRDGRRDGRRGRSDRSERPRNTGGSGDRERSGHGGGRGRHSMQTTDLPAISDLLKPGQEILVQIAKEPIAKKGARITSHIALPGRFLVFMPTVNHTGVSRKIESDGERRRLKEILLSEKGDASGGFIVRTAAEGASEEELRNDLRFLLNLWADIKARSESSKSPALIYHDLNLIERILRDQVTDNFSAIWVDTEAEYERVLRFLQRFQPSLIRRVKLYTKETPLFEQFGITEEINKALHSKVWLKSGGSIVIDQTEALVAIDINTGKYVGKTARLEDTIVKTNLDAIPEIVRQIRLRDLGGIIIIDFIDMDERKNRNRVMAALEEELKSDRAPSKVLPFNDFGLVAITRKRVKQSLERTLSTTCSICDGTGMVKSPVTVCNDIYIEMRKMHKLLDRGDVMLRVHPEVVKQLKASGAKWLLDMEEMVGKTILVKSDPSLHPEQFDIH
jgi:ribonuclease G